LTAQDGETLFKGIFCGVGPAARKLPEIWGKNALASTAARAATGKVANPLPAAPAASAP